MSSLGAHRWHIGGSILPEDTSTPGMLEAVDRMGKEDDFRKALVEGADEVLEGYRRGGSGGSHQRERTCGNGE